MRKVAKLLTDYVIKKSMVDEADREVYEYGFVITLEVGLYVYCRWGNLLCNYGWEWCP